ncbi:hypothetical protein [Parvularcula sp. IMCC14364]|uniref:hypothetical protein n=1 Tax=Parvularcula sp. IMCC14364 TaxID=3067902 RepID=UPI002740A3BA|nr:hypothetical protein [Parvularcula sp. IMCC14364]
MTDLPAHYHPPRITLPSAETDFELENAKCGCVNTNLEAFRREAKLYAQATIPENIYDTIASAEPVFLPEDTIEQIRQSVAALNAVFKSNHYREEVFAAHPDLAQCQPDTRSVLTGFDFHLTPEGPKLIEVNTNAGGALLVSSMMRAQQACCRYMEDIITGFGGDGDAGKHILSSFLHEWQYAGRTGRAGNTGNADALGYIVIVDEQPEKQFLYPEFVLFRQLFESAGIQAAITAPQDLYFQDGHLRHQGRIVDMVYNRLTDFVLAEPENSALRQALIRDAAVVTPSPRHHRLMANKDNLARLSDRRALARWGLPRASQDQLATIIPLCEKLTPESAERLWRTRRQWFFKPLAGYGSRGAYRGDKITRRVWQDMLAAEYIAQEFVPPGQTTIIKDGQPVAMKLDIRAYAYDGDVQLLAARRYQGQTTNMRTPGGGFACVYASAEGRAPGN